MLDKDVKISCGTADGFPIDDRFRYTVACDVQDYDTTSDISSALIKDTFTEVYSAEFARYIWPTEPLTQVRLRDDANS